jgi:hypothetical protein
MTRVACFTLLRLFGFFGHLWGNQPLEQELHSCFLSHAEFNSAICGRTSLP